MTRFSYKILIIMALIGLGLPQWSLAATVGNRLKNVVTSQPTYDYDSTTQNTVTEYAGNLISVFLGLLGVIFVILMIYAGYNWMTAAGNVEKVEKAGRIMRASVIGLLITGAVYAMWIFLFKKIVSL